MLVNIHRKKTPNQGDLASAPLRYFSHQVQPIYIDILDCAAPTAAITNYLDQASHIVLGGGGLIDNIKFDPAFSKLKELYAEKIIIWGSGSNSANSEYKTDFTNIKHIGLRDFPGEHLWVPCGSCLSSVLTEVIENRNHYCTGGIGILENDSGAKVAKVSDCGINGIRRFGNKKVSMLEMVGFIASCDILVTSSYHAVYWATLVGIPVIGIPTSSKFYSLKHKVPLAKSNSWLGGLSETKVYAHALDECIEANINYKNSLPVALSSLELSPR